MGERALGTSRIRQQAEPAARSAHLLDAQPRHVGEHLSFQHDPHELQAVQEFMESLGSHSRWSAYALREMAKSPWASCIIATRCNQIASFAEHREDQFGVGHQIRKRESSKSMTKAETKEAERLERLLQTSGQIRGDHEVFTRPSFDEFLRALTYDSLTLDWRTFEVTPDVSGKPYKWDYVDAGTVFKVTPSDPYGDYGPDDAQYVQVVQEQRVAWWRPGELCAGIRRPRSDMRSNGYGHPELTEMVEVMTGMLYGFSHNLNWFRQGGPRGMLAVMGAMPPKKFRALQRHLAFMAKGVQNAWRMVVANPQGDGADVKWVPFGVSNREMEFAEWINACFRLMCSLWQIDPSETGFYYQGSGGERGALFESSPEAKLKAGKDKGLRPLAVGLAADINRYIIQPLNPDFEIRFLGLDAMSESERAALDKAMLESSYTVNEVRAIRGEGDIEGGDYILNPQYLQIRQALEQKAMMEQQQAEGGQGEAGAPQVGADDYADPWDNEPISAGDVGPEAARAAGQYGMAEDRGGAEAPGEATKALAGRSIVL